MTGAPAAPDGGTDAWFAGGLRFACTQCGNCCTGGPGAVWFTDEEAASMAHDLGEGVDEFRRRWARRVMGRWSLREVRTGYGFDCVFLDRASAPGRALCRVYRSRPGQCRTWPFWPENLASPEAWRDARARTPCPGMDRGPVVPLAQIRVQLDAQRAAEPDPPGF
ncbi:MAG: YkgJ family cysteine cluster protein [Phycisphaeraceae bacterium]|nr:YkgJ family cysteine cluster protein [Phycisphaeraceae bacterium]